MIRSPSEDELPGIVAFVAPFQARPESRIPYFDESADDIAAEIERWGDDWPARSLVVERDGHLVGFVGVDVDHELERCWIYGPFTVAAAWSELTDDLLQAAVDLARVNDLELLGDGGHTRLAALAKRHGFSRGRASVGLGIPRVAVERLPRAAVPPLEERHRDSFAALHETLFPRTYYSGAQLADQHARTAALVLTIVEDDEVVGYAAGREAGEHGYVDFLGVTERARGRGHGRALTTAICRALLEDPGRAEIRLTVYEDNTEALALYSSLGFERLLTMVGYRRRPETAA